MFEYTFLNVINTYFFYLVVVKKVPFGFSSVRSTFTVGLSHVERIANHTVSDGNAWITEGSSSGS